VMLFLSAESQYFTHSQTNSPGTHVNAYNIAKYELGSSLNNFTHTTNLHKPSEYSHTQTDTASEK